MNTNFPLNKPVFDYFNIVSSNVSSIEQAKVICLCDMHYDVNYLIPNISIIDHFSVPNSNNAVLVEDDQSYMDQKNHASTRFLNRKVTVIGWDCEKSRAKIREYCGGDIMDVVAETHLDRNKSMGVTIEKSVKAFQRIFVIAGQYHFVNQLSLNQTSKRQSQFLDGVNHIKKALEQYSYVILNRNKKPLPISQKEEHEMQSYFDKIGENSYDVEFLWDKTIKQALATTPQLKIIPDELLNLAVEPELKPRSICSLF